MDEEKD